MGVRRSEERLAEAAKLYYVDDRNQEEVADALGTTRSNVSRMLQAARRQGIIKFNVTHPLTRQTVLEERIQETFGIAEAAVVCAESDAAVRERTGEMAARWMAERVTDGPTIAVSWGRTLRLMIEQVEVDRAYDVDVVQLSGDATLAPECTSHELVRDLASRLGGQYSYLHAPVILDSPQTARALEADVAIAAQLTKARAADMAVVGIGGMESGFSVELLASDKVTAAQRSELMALEPAGVVAGRFYDVKGQEVGPFKGRVVGLDLDELRGIDTVVGVAAGPQKARPLWAALRGGLLDVVVCDQSAASAALHMELASE